MCRLIATLGCFFLIFFSCVANSEDEGYFDYRETKAIALYMPDAEGPRYLSRPFAEGLPDSGKRFYQLTLPYLLQLREITLPLPDPLYYFDFISDSSLKRFSVGERWIATEGQVTFVTSDSDWKAIERIVRSRIEATEPEAVFGKSMIFEHYSERMKSNGVSKNVERQSLREAIDSVGLYVDPYDDSPEIENSSSTGAGIESRPRKAMESGKMLDTGSDSQSDEVEPNNLPDSIATTDPEPQELASNSLYPRSDDEGSSGTPFWDNKSKATILALVAIIASMVLVLRYMTMGRR